MPRNISFSMTTPQFRDRTKTVTRRLGWWALKPGTVLCGVEKARGLKKGEKIRRLGLIEIVSVRRERLDTITANDVNREGFRGMAPEAFVDMFCQSHRCEPDAWVNRIKFRYLEGEVSEVS